MALASFPAPKEGLVLTDYACISLYPDSGCIAKYTVNYILAT